MLLENIASSRLLSVLSAMAAPGGPPAQKRQGTLFEVGVKKTNDPNAAFRRPNLAPEVREQQAARELAALAAAETAPAAPGPAVAHSFALCHLVDHCQTLQICHISVTISCYGRAMGVAHQHQPAPPAAHRPPPATGLI